MKGYRTILAGLLMAVAPSGLTYLAGVDWTHVVGPNAALVIAGIVTIAMRAITDTPIASARAFVLLAAVAGLLSAGAPAGAADLAAKPLPLATVSKDCTVQNCSGFYVGAHLDGAGTNADILGSGIAGSVFADGGGIGLHGGYQLWNGQFFAAVEVGGSYDIPASGQAVPVTSRWMGTEFVKLGYGLNGLFNTGAASPSQGPVAVFSQWQNSLISLYALTGGVNKSFGSGWATGAGAEYTIGGGYNFFAEYFHAAYNATVGGTAVNTDNVIRFGVNRKF